MSNYFTLTSHNDRNGNDYGTWQPNAKVNQRIHVDTGIASNWKYRQYMQKNAQHIMKYNTMESFQNSGNNPYMSNAFYPSVNTSSPAYGLRNSDLKQDFLTKENLQFRKVAPTIPTNF